MTVGKLVSNSVVMSNVTTTSSISSMPYAIDAELCNKGRRFAATKRRVKFSFGFGNLEAINQGLSSVECRGEEHQVVMIWSLTSGKQRVLADGIEVHFSRNSVVGKFECQWTMKSGHLINVTGAWAPLSKDPRVFDLRIDGLSFWDMPKIYQLGGGSGSNGSGASQTVVPVRRRTIAEVSPQISFSNSSSSISQESQQNQNYQQNHHAIHKSSSPSSVADLCGITQCHAHHSSTRHNPHLNRSASHSYAPYLPKHPFNHNQNPTSFDQALSSLVNMERNAFNTADSSSRRPSLSDLSVQSAFASTQPSRHNELVSNSYGWSTNQSQPYAVYSFAG